MTDKEMQLQYESLIDRPTARFDINPFVVDGEGRVLLAQRISTVEFGGHWHMPGGKVFVDERIPEALRRMTLLKTGLEIEVFTERLNDSIVGVYDDPKRDPREHVVGITFLCRLVGGTIAVGGNCTDVRFLRKEEALALPLAFGHDYMLEDAFVFLETVRE